MKEIIDKLDSLKIKNLCFAKDYQENEKTSHRLRKLFAKDLYMDVYSIFDNFHNLTIS